MWVISKVGLDNHGRAQRFVWRWFTPRGEPGGALMEVDRNEVVGAYMSGDKITTVWPTETGSVTGGPNVRVRADAHGEEWPELVPAPSDPRRIEDLPKI